MSNRRYFIPAHAHSQESIIKRSQFITYLAHAETREQAEQMIRTLREQHPQANHVCWAYIAGAPNTTVISMSDDGEPSGTAGRPMLSALQYSGLGEIVAAVVRYFGGTKLGTGGLQRAYGGAVKEALDNLTTLEKIPLVHFTFHAPYALETDIRHLFNQYQATLTHCDYQQDIQIRGSVAAEHFATLQQQLQNRSAGQIEIKTQ